MIVVVVVIVSIFLALESSNVLALYFAPETQRANAVGMFKAWEESKQHPQLHDLMRYLVYWVAGTKLIFILLFIAILVFGSDAMQAAGVGALVLAILSFYWRLFPLIRRMDADGQIQPAGYSTRLGVMIAVFVAVLLVAFGFGLAAALRVWPYSSA